VSNVRVGKHIELTVEANPVIEDFRIISAAQVP
jgi:phosphoribosylformylglycinamidine (FGAM) synthase PurS component